MKHVRLYQNTALNVGDTLSLDKSVSHHLTKVLRFPVGQNITLFNGDGADYTAKVLAVKVDCQVKILSKSQNLSESTLDITLAQGIAKGEKMDFIIQKAVELGVGRIVPIITERCVVRLGADKSQKRQQHWQKIAIAASEQSGRAIVPIVDKPIALDGFLQKRLTNVLVLHHRSQKTLLALPIADEVCIVIGPEGGLSAQENARIIDSGAQSLCLGKRVLRTETAALVAIANMQLLWGNPLA